MAGQRNCHCFGYIRVSGGRQLFCVVSECLLVPFWERPHVQSVWTLAKKGSVVNQLKVYEVQYLSFSLLGILYFRGVDFVSLVDVALS